MSILGNVAGLAAVRPDWAQTDESSADYIRNKPDLSAAAEELARALELAEAALPRGGGCLEGELDMDGFRLVNLPEPQDGSDPATKAYVDGAAGKRLYLEVTLTPEDWTGEEGGPYTQRVYCAGITGEDRPHYGPVYSGERDARLAQKESWAVVDELDTETDYLTFTCLEEKPQAELTVQLEVAG